MNADRQISDAGVDLIKQREEFVAYPYDDKVGKLGGRYVEWKGGAIKGTITIAYGHTDAAGIPKIVVGMRVTEPQACAILAKDLAPVVAQVNKALKVDVSQNEFDALVSLTFNCPSALPHVAELINEGDKSAVPDRMLKYVYSKGERMRGLVNRRLAEIALWNTPDNTIQVASK